MVASMSILYVVLSQYVESEHFLLLLTIALLVTNLVANSTDKKKHLMNLPVVVLILETQQDGIWTVPSLEIPTNISGPMSFPFFYDA